MIKAKGFSLRRQRSSGKLPYISLCIIFVIFMACGFAEIFMTYDPKYMDLSVISQAPGGGHYFGTDTMGRDIFSMILYGGRLSLAVGIGATVLSVLIAVVVGCVSGIAGRKIDDLLMRFAEILMSVPQILLVIFAQGIFGKPTIFSIILAIGLTSWPAVAKMVRSEVKQIRNSEYILLARVAGGGFFYILRRHLAPNFFSAIMFMIVTNFGSSIALEATLSFLGIGLPTNTLSWGTLMSLSQQAALTGCWWVISIPGAVLMLTIICITEVGEYIRAHNRRGSLI